MTKKVCHLCALDLWIIEIFLFMLCLITLSIAQTMQCKMVGWQNWSGCGRKRLCPIWRYFPAFTWWNWGKLQKTAVRNFYIPAEIWIKYIQNTSQIVKPEPAYFIQLGRSCYRCVLCCRPTNVRREQSGISQQLWKARSWVPSEKTLGAAFTVCLEHNGMRCDWPSRAHNMCCI